MSVRLAKRRHTWPLVSLLMGGSGTLARPSQAQEASATKGEQPTASTAASAPEQEPKPPRPAAQDEHADLGEVAKQLANPVSSLWSLASQNDLTLLSGDLSDAFRVRNNFAFQPILPVPLGPHLNLINRVVLQVPYVEYLDEAGSWQHETGFGDLGLVNILSPTALKTVVVGAGSTLLFPTASHDALGQGKWQIGPAAVVAYLGDHLLLGALVQQWWSVGGDDDRPDTSTMNAQYFIKWRVTPTFNLGVAPNIVVDWEADEDKLQLPIGLFGFDATTKIGGKLPLKVGAELHYYVVTPDALGPRYNVRFLLTPVLPNPFGPSDKK